MMPGDLIAPIGGVCVCTCVCVHVCVCVCVRVSDKPGWCMARDRGVCTALNGPVVR